MFYPNPPTILLQDSSSSSVPQLKFPTHRKIIMGTQSEAKKEKQTNTKFPLLIPFLARTANKKKDNGHTNNEQGMIGRRTEYPRNKTTIEMSSGEEEEEKLHLPLKLDRKSSLARYPRKKRCQNSVYVLDVDLRPQTTAHSIALFKTPLSLPRTPNTLPQLYLLVSVLVPSSLSLSSVFLLSICDLSTFNGTLRTPL
jgi:hypothetical protein